MEEKEQYDDERWREVLEHMDLLFAKVGTVEQNQQKFEARFDLSNGVLEQMLRDQQKLARQMEITGQAMAQLTLHQRDMYESPPSPKNSETAGGAFPKQKRQQGGGFHQYWPPDPYHRDQGGDTHSKRGFMPKMSFPRFDGNNPCIWKDKCTDYFHLMDIPESMWATAASLHMEGNAEKWMQVYKRKCGLGLRRLGSFHGSCAREVWGLRLSTCY